MGQINGNGRVSPSPFMMISAHAPENKEYQQLRGGDEEEQLCSEVGADESGIELSDDDTALPASVQNSKRKWEAGTPLTNPLQYLQNPQTWTSDRDDEASPGDNNTTAPIAPPIQEDPGSPANDPFSSPGTPQSVTSPRFPPSPKANPTESVSNGVDKELAVQIRALRSEYTTQAQNLRHRLEMVEKIAGAATDEERSRDDHLEYVRKWVESLVSNVCAAHPNETDPSVLMRDFQGKLKSLLETQGTHVDNVEVC